MNKHVLFSIFMTLFSWSFLNAQCDFVAPYTEDFEDAGALDACWIQSTSDDLDWEVNSGSSSYSETGPESAHGGTYYVHMNPPFQSNGQTASLLSPNIDLSNVTNPYLEFYYHMYGSGMDPDGSVAIDISSDGGTNWTNLWSRTGSQSNNWLSTNVSLSGYSGVVNFKITATISSGYYWLNHFALDDFSILATPTCRVHFILSHKKK